MVGGKGEPKAIVLGAAAGQDPPVMGQKQCSKVKCFSIGQDVHRVHGAGGSNDWKAIASPSYTRKCTQAGCE